MWEGESVDQICNIVNRVPVGSKMPAGECPMCGDLCDEKGLGVHQMETMIDFFLGAFMPANTPVFKVGVVPIRDAFRAYILTMPIALQRELYSFVVCGRSTAEKVMLIARRIDPSPVYMGEVKEHFDHISKLEVAWYGDSHDPVSVTVECTECGCVVFELFNADMFDEENDDAEADTGRSAGSSEGARGELRLDGARSGRLAGDHQGPVDVPDGVREKGDPAPTRTVDRDVAQSLTVWCQKWEESERGWGVRPDGFSLHFTAKSLEMYLTEYVSRLPKEVPDVYSRTSGTSYTCEVDKELYDRLRVADEEGKFDSASSTTTTPVQAASTAG